MFLGMVPVRISFAGGGTDMPEYYEEYGGSVVSSSITKFTYVIINPRHDDLFQSFSSDFQMHHDTTTYDNLQPQHGSEIAVTVLKYLKYREGANFLICSDVQPGSGLGASSALTVNFVKTVSSLQGKDWTKEKIAQTSFHIERKLLNHSVGMQDEYASSFGGFNYIKFEKNKISVHPIILKKNILEELEKNLLLFFIGNSGRDNKIILSNQIERIKNNEKTLLDSLHFVKHLADDFYKSLKKSDINAIGELLNRGWEAKKKFVKGVTNEKIDKIYEMALKNGATGGKLTGAGGGGHMLFYCESKKQEKLVKKMTNLGFNHIKFGFHNEGPRVLNLYDFSK
jgi:D-glycero-alpha-D-manno-heptose-7-phosphate kinase